MIDKIKIYFIGDNLNSLISISLRILISLARFMLILFITTQYSFSILGEFSLIITTLVVMTFFIGFEIYLNTSRVLIKNKKHTFYYIKEHFYFIITSYIIISPLLLTFFILELIDYQYLIIVFLLLLFELISNEQYRLLIALKHPTIANIVLFTRSALWIYLFILLDFFGLNFNNPIQLLLNFWLISVSISIFIPIVYFKLYRTFKLSFKNIISWKRFLKYCKKSYILFLSSLVMVIFNTIDKFIIKMYETYSVLGIYTLYFSLSNIVFTFVLAGIISIKYPSLLESYTINNNQYYLNLKKFNIQIISTTLVISAMSIILLISYLSYIHDTEKYTLLIDNLSVYIFLLISFIIYTIHMKEHYDLYIKNKDNEILKSHLIMLIIYLLSLFPLIKLYSINGVALSHLIASVAIYLLKIYYRKKNNNGENNGNK